MCKYIFNPQYTIIHNENEEVDFVFSSNMEQVYLLHKIELLILQCFSLPRTIEEAMVTIKLHFSSESFNIQECKEFIDSLINEGIITHVNN